MSKNKRIVKSDNGDRQLKKETVLKLLTLLLVAGGIFAVYRIMMTFPYFELVFAAYLVALTVFIAVYIIYNRGFARKNMTVDMLPDEWSYEEKAKFIEDGKRRLKKSSWMLMFIVGFIFTFAFDLFELYLIPWLNSLIP